MIPVPMTFKQIGFTGEYSQLKHMGFEFQKLYASNYMQWHHEASDIRIWKKGADLTINSIQGMEGQLLQMMLDGHVFHMKPSMSMGYYLEMYVNTVTNELTTDPTEYVKEMEDSELFLTRIWRAFSMNKDTMLMLQKLARLGWIHVKEIEGSHYVDEDLLEAA